MAFKQALHSFDGHSTVLRLNSQNWGITSGVRVHRVAGAGAQRNQQLAIAVAGECGQKWVLSHIIRPAADTAAAY